MARSGLSTGRVLALFVGVSGVGIVIVGSTMTWAEYGRDIAPLFGPRVRLSGLDLVDDDVSLGQICIVCAVVAGLALLLAQIRGLAFLAGITVAGGVFSGGLVLVFRDDPGGALERVAGIIGWFRLGPGSMVVIAGSLALAVAGLMTLVTRRTDVVVQAEPARAGSRRPEGARPNRFKVPVPDLAPNWLPDPSARFEHRFWDGTRWTERVARGGVELMDPYT